MNVQGRIDEVLAHEQVMSAGLLKEHPIQHLSVIKAVVEYIWELNDKEHIIRRFELIVYNRGEGNESAFYSTEKPEFLRVERSTYHTDEDVKIHIETEYLGAEVIAIRQTINGVTDIIEVDAKWVDGYYYTVRYRAWGVGQFAQEQITQI